MEIDLKLDAGRLAGALARVVLALDAAYIVTQFFVRVLGWPRRNIIFVLFDLNHEMNIPSLYSGAALFLCALLLGMTANGERASRRPFVAWAGLSFIFAFLSADELFAVHEKLNDPLRAALHTAGGVLHYAWVIPYMIFVAVFAAVYLPFVLRLPKGTRRLFILSGLIFVGGAVGCELIGNVILKSASPGSIAMGVEILMEETMEMGGIILFLYTLVSYVQAELPGLSLRVGFSGSSSPRA